MSKKHGLKQGPFRLRNPSRYKGNPNNVVYRSSWECKLFLWLDNESNPVQWWSSEETVIWYRSPVDNRNHRYFPDVTVCFTNGRKVMIEVKPLSQTMPPKRPKKLTESYQNKVMEYGKNSAKWAAAQAYCVMHGMEFRIFTETELGIKK